MLQIMYNSCVLKIGEQNLGLINSKISDDVFNYSRQTQTIWNTKAVSYTHLDVYKRQVTAHSANVLFQAFP